MRLLIHENRTEMAGEPLVDLTARESRAFETLARQSHQWLEPRQRRWKASFGPQGWNFAEINARQQLLLAPTAGAPRVIADVIWVGTWRLDLWVWSWANASVPRYSRKEMEQVKQWGDEMALRPLTCGWLEANENECWDLTAICAQRLRAEAVWRTPGEDRGGFLLLFNVRWD